MALAPERLSRFLTFLLRHKPKDYPLAIDREGFAPWRDVVELVQQRFYDVTEGQIRALIAGAEKKRFEIRGDKVRATYGHSFPVDLGGTATEPPAQLYFGAARDLAPSDIIGRSLDTSCLSVCCRRYSSITFCSATWARKAINDPNEGN